MKKTGSETCKLQVVGNPIGHSKSPDIHQAFARQFDRSLDYQKALVDVDSFDQHATDFFANQGGLGMNVTVPFKEAACSFVNHLATSAEQAGAVNTVKYTNGQSWGHNTDGVGLINDITRRWQFPLAGRLALILGAGGSTRGILQPLVDAGVATVVVANRTAAKAARLVERIKAQGIAAFVVPLPVTLASLASVTGGLKLPEVVINTTSIGLQLDAMDSLMAPEVLTQAFCYDLSYGTQARFHSWAKTAGALKSVDGLGMLVEQAAASYNIWFQEWPDTEPVYQQLMHRIRADEN